VNIREARVEDAVEIARVVRESYDAHPDSVTPADMLNYHPEAHVEGMKDPATRWRVLTVNGKPVAVAMWRLIPGLAHLHLLYVDAANQGSGFGSRLLKVHQEQARAEQAETRLYTLHCLRDSVWAMRFYKRHGYTQYEPGDEYRVMELTIWIDACRRHDNGWPLRADKVLFYKKAHG
jgi:GNAT superfamily N-acetyltransferase